MRDLSGGAGLLMANEAFAHVVKEAREWQINKALACDPKDDDGRRKYLDAAKTVDRVVSHLEALMAVPVEEQADPTTYYQDQAKKRWAFLSK